MNSGESFVRWRDRFLKKEHDYKTKYCVREFSAVLFEAFKAGELSGISRTANAISSTKKKTKKVYK